MGRCSIQIVMGPAGSGKSTYCYTIQQHAATQQHIPIHIINLDPAAEYYSYEPIGDIRDIITVDDVMNELQLGPNGSLIYCMEYFLTNGDGLVWLQDILDNYDNDEDIIILDCPGQIELYTHISIHKQLLDTLKLWGYDGKMVSIFCIDSGFILDINKFISGSLLSLSVMIHMELPHITLLTKCDLIQKTKNQKEEKQQQQQQQQQYINDNIDDDNNDNINDINDDNEQDDIIERILNYGSATDLWNMEQRKQSLYRYKNNNNNNKNNNSIMDDNNNNNIMSNDNNDDNNNIVINQLEKRRQKRIQLTSSIVNVLDDYHMVSYLPYNITDEENLDHVLLTINHCIQYGEDSDIRTPDIDINENHE